MQHSAIKEIIDTNTVVLFMKGDKNFPQCGYSGYVAKILQDYGVDFKDINVLKDPELRESIKIYSNWPTIPQLYIEGEFIGGADIVREMQSDGSLTKKLSTIQNK